MTNIMKNFKRLITLALKDGKITDKERELILKKANNLGIDEIEAEMVLEGMISDYDNGIKNEKSVEINPDGYAIEDAERRHHFQLGCQGHNLCRYACRDHSQKLYTKKTQHL